jgi:trk system potassium uptake protein TrkA
MFAVIAGGDATGAQLASLLLAQDHEVRLVEHRRQVLAHIHRTLPTETIVEGHALDAGVLEAAGAAKAHVVAACMEGDAQNLALCYLARERFRVARTIACVNNPGNAWLFDAKFHVDVSLNQADILASLIEQEMSLGDMMTLAKLRRGRFSLVGEKIPEGARAVGVAIKDLPLPKNSVIAAIIRHGEILIPRGPLRFEAGDEVLAIVDAEGADELAALFGRPGTPR